MALFEEGKQFPPKKDVERIADYITGERIFKGYELQDIYKRASKLLKGSPHESQLKTLYTAVNIAEMLCTKPADLMVGEPPIFESGDSEDGPEQDALNRIVEENDMPQLIHEMTTSGGFRGDMYLKAHYSYRQDFSELLSFGGRIPESVSMEPIIEAVNPLYVYPEESDYNAKKFKAVNIAFIVWEEGFNTLNTSSIYKNDEEEGKIPYLVVERHIPGFIFHQKFKLYARTVDTQFGVDVPIYTIGKIVNTGRNQQGLKDIEETGVPFPLVFHAPYKAIDSEWQGLGFIKSVKDLLAAINDRITQISYILWKHADPTAYGPDLQSVDGNASKWGGKYIPVSKDDVEPGYMVWEAQLSSAFQELDTLLGLVFMAAETPQFLFGTVLTNDKAGSGTSHTDGSAIKSRFLPITSKVNRIRLHLDKAIRDALYAVQLLEQKANEKVEDFKPYTPTYPSITWKDGIPKDEKEEAEIMAIRTNGATTLDDLSAIKRMDNLNDTQAKEILDRIKDNQKERELATPDVFNEVGTNENKAILNENNEG